MIPISRLRPARSAKSAAGAPEFTRGAYIDHFIEELPPLAHLIRLRLACRVRAVTRRYTHRIAIANSRLVVFDGERVTFKWKNYRAKLDARTS
jgi:hypothetical protein